MAIADGNKSFSLAKPDIIFTANCIPNIECIIASINGTPKNIPICLNNDLFIVFSSQPIFLKIVYLCLLSELSVSCFNARIAELAIRNIIHHSWLDDNAEGKEFVKELYNHTTAAANVHKMKGLSALADGSSLIVPQKSKGDNPQKDKAAHTALFKYNDKGSNVLVVYSNKQMDTENKNTGAYLSGETDNVPYISLGYIDPHKEVDATDVDGKTVYEIKDDGTVTDKPVKENAIAGNVAKDGDKYKKLKYGIPQWGDFNAFVICDGWTNSNDGSLGG